jgi:hypothetical protein
VAALPSLLAVGQPVWTDDLWWHLALGEAYAREGPWLAADPLLFTAAGPPIPASWLADLALHGVIQTLGIQGLRAFHVAAALGILALVYRLLRRASSVPLASVGTLAFLVLAAYRLVQLRPHLLGILCTLGLLALVVLPRRPPSWTRVALAVGLMGLWANLHASFLLGPALLGAAIMGLLGARLVGQDTGEDTPARTRRLAVVLVLGLLATLANPGGITPHTAYFAADTETLTLGRVSDEWRPLALFEWPTPGLPPQPLGFGVYWALLVATLVTLARSFRRGVVAARDPALAVAALLSLAAPLVAVRFLWLSVVSGVWLAHAAQPSFAHRGNPVRWGVAAAAVVLALGFFSLGPWPSISRGMPWTLAGYATPYAATKYHANGVWMLRDAGVEGRMFQEYAHGGFLGYALAPRIQTFVNGSLNVPGEILEANRAIREHRGLRADETLLELLDALEVDLFFGIRSPVARQDGRPWYFTSRHLDGAAGWIPIFRNIDTTLYLRTNARNRDNQARVERYYASRGVPYDPDRGFDIERVITSNAAEWALEMGVAPYHLAPLTTAATSVEIADRTPAREQLAALYAALGICARALRYDRQALRESPENLSARRRRVWCLLHERRFDEARAEAEALPGALAGDPLSPQIAAAARELPAASESDTAARLATLPLFGEGQARFLRAGFAGPVARELR